MDAAQTLPETGQTTVSAACRPAEPASIKIPFPRKFISVSICTEARAGTYCQYRCLREGQLRYCTRQELIGRQLPAGSFCTSRTARNLDRFGVCAPSPHTPASRRKHLCAWGALSEGSAMWLLLKISQVAAE